MKKILACLALWALSASVFAQNTTIGVSFTYTPGAVSYAGGLPALKANVDSIIAATNTAYAASNPPIAITLSTSYAPATGSPGDNAALTQQLIWAQNSPVALGAKAGTGSSISIQLSDPGNTVTQGYRGAALPINTQQATAALNYEYLASQLELTISQMIGAGSGYEGRKRTYPSDPQQGAGYCFHSRDYQVTGNEVSIPVPYLSYWRISNYTSTDAATPENSCKAYREFLVAGGASTTSYASSSVSTTGSQTFCDFYSNAAPPVLTAHTLIVYTARNDSGGVQCADVAIAAYSSQTPQVSNYPYLYALGDATHDSVAAMNGRRTTVADFTASNMRRYTEANAFIARVVAFFFGY